MDTWCGSTSDRLEFALGEILTHSNAVPPAFRQFDRLRPFISRAAVTPLHRYISNRAVYDRGL
jgi:hypothetical protein